MRTRGKAILTILVVVAGACDDGAPALERVSATAVAAASAPERNVRSAREPRISMDSYRSPLYTSDALRSIRGQDDREDLYCHGSRESLLRGAEVICARARASMAIFDGPDLEYDTVTGTYKIAAKYLPLQLVREPQPGGGLGYAWCEDAAFVAQARGASCSGVLIEGQRILSVKHCLAEPNHPDHPDRPNQKFVFGFAMTDAQSPRSFSFSPEDVCRPREGAVPQHFNEEASVLDIVCDERMDVTPAPIAATRFAPEDAQDVYAIGYPMSLPAKFSGWGRFIPPEPGARHFAGYLDLMPGNSGSPVFNARHEIVGVVNDDGNDAHRDDHGAGCRRWLSCTGLCSDSPKIYFVTSDSIPPSRAPRSDES